MADQNNDLKNQQLLSAYVDGEIGVADRALAEKLIRDNPDYAQLVEQWRESGINLRALPKRRLDDGFAGRVMGSIAQTADQTNTMNSPANAAGSSNQSNHRLALLAIGALCASILLTLFVFPAMVSQPSGTAAVAANDAELETESKAESDPEGDDSSAVVAQPESASSSPSPVAASPRPMVRIPRSMKLPNSGLESGAVSAIEMAQPADHIEQVLHVKVENADREFDIEKVLSKHSIKTFGVKDPSPAETQSNVEAIYAVASSDQIRAAAEQLVKESSARIAIVSVPKMSIDDSSATRLKSRSFDSRLSDSELTQIDQWFGLAAPSDDSRSIRFLILLTQ